MEKKEKVKGKVTIEERPDYSKYYICGAVAALIVIVLIVVISTVAKESGYKKEAKNFVKETFSKIAEADQTTINDIIEYDTVINGFNQGQKSYTTSEEVSADNVNTTPENDMFKKFFKNIKYEIKSVKAEKDKATVVVKVKNTNVGNVFANYFLEAIRVSSSAALSSKTQEQVGTQLAAYIDSQLEENSGIPVQEVELTIDIRKNADGWVITNDKTQLFDAFLPGLRSTLQTTLNTYANY